MTTNLMRSWLMAAGLATFLAACGGGGGGDGATSPTVVAPPSAPATLTQSGSEAMAAVQALNSGATALVEQSTTLGSGSLFFPLGASSSPLNLRNIIASSSREQALAREIVPCSDLGLAPCSGSVTFETNLDNPDGTNWSAGSYFSMTFNDLDSSTIALNGTLRLDFLTAINLDAGFASAQVKISLTNLSGTVNGISFGPENVAALLVFDASGIPTVTIDGMWIDGLEQLYVTDADNYSASGTYLRRSHWSSTSGYVDVDFTSWDVVNGLPTVGSTATITAGTSSATIAVLSSSQNLVVYRVWLTVNGITSVYDVTADYSTNPPTYTVVQ